MAEGRVVVDYINCMACGVCAQTCPFSYLEMTKPGFDKYNKVYPQLSSGSTCTGCGICANACPLECLKAFKGGG